MICGTRAIVSEQISSVVALLDPHLFHFLLFLPSNIELSINLWSLWYSFLVLTS